MGTFRYTYDNLSRFAEELGLRIYGVPGAYMVGIPHAGGGYRAVNGPCSNAENFAYLRGVRDGRTTKHWRVYEANSKLEFGRDYPSLEAARRAKARYQADFPKARYYIRCIHSAPFPA